MIRRVSFVLLLVTALSVLAPAQWPENFGNPPRAATFNVTKFIESTSTNFKTQDTYVDFMWLSNTTGAAVTVRISDKSTQCNSGACDLIPTVSVAANTAYLVIAGGGLKFRGGINWQASSANAVIVQIRGTN